MLYFQLSTLDKLASNITGVWVKTLEEVFRKHLHDGTLNETLKLAEDIKNQSAHVRGDIERIHSSVGNVTLDSVLNITNSAELYR